jgi:selenium metabolism protein YedF
LSIRRRISLKTIDMLGQPCPIPVINAKKILSEPGADGVTVLVDNIIAVQNLEKMAKGNGCGFSWQEEGASRFAVSIAGNIPQNKALGERAATSQACPDADRLVVLIGADHLGEGADQLGKLLMKGFIFSITQLDPLPEAVIFLNGGAHLTSDGANTVPDLRGLEDKGAAILTCGTCANYYGIVDKLAVGSITDMADIVNRIAGAGRLITV